MSSHHEIGHPKSPLYPMSGCPTSRHFEMWVCRMSGGRTQVCSPQDRMSHLGFLRCGSAGCYSLPNDARFGETLRARPPPLRHLLLLPPSTFLRRGGNAQSLRNIAGGRAAQVPFHHRFLYRDARACASAGQRTTGRNTICRAAGAQDLGLAEVAAAPILAAAVLRLQRLHG